MQTVIYEACPVCGSHSIQFSLSVKDLSVTKEVFEVWECRDCTLRFTQNAPSPDFVGRYYESQDYVSHTDTREGVINQLYHNVRKITLSQKKGMVANATGLGKGNLLDIGAGTGAFAALMRESDWKVTGIEPDAATRTRARDRYGLDLQPAPDLFSLPAQSFDAITMWHVLEHVHDLQGYLAQIKKLLKPGGKYFIAVPNYTSHDAKKYGEWWAAYDVPRHLYHFSPKSISTLLGRHEFQLLKTVPMWFDSFYISMLSEKYKHGQNRLLNAVWTGLVTDIKTAADVHACSSLIYIAGLV